MKFRISPRPLGARGEWHRVLLILPRIVDGHVVMLATVERRRLRPYSHTRFGEFWDYRLIE